jgi:hypothetical protein
MNEQTVDQAPAPASHPRKSWKARLGVLGAALVVTLVLGAVALDKLMPDVPNRAQGFSARLGWYVHDGQLQADMRTLGAAIQYLAASEQETPVATNGASLPVAGNAAPSLPKS